MKNNTFWIILPALWLCQGAAMAQADVFGNPLTNNILTQSNEFDNELDRLQGRFGTSFMGTTLSSQRGGSAQYSPSGPPLAQWGPLQLYPHLMDEISYGNALPSEGNTNSTTLINQLSPGMLLKLGSIWTLDYTPSIYWYSNPLFHNRTDQDVVLNGLTTNGNWTLSLMQRYDEVTQPLAETGTQPEQDDYTTALGAVWQMSAKSSLELNVDQTARFLDSSLLDSSLYEWKTEDWFSYQFMPQLSAGLGAAAGYDDLSASSDMPFEQLLGRLVFRPGEKLAVTVMGGAEERQFIDPHEPAFLNPIFQALALYQAREGTLLSASGSRMVVPSLYQGDVNVITTVTAGIRQHIVGNVQLELEGGYTSEPFNNVEPVVNPDSFPPNATSSPLSVIRTDTRESLDVRLYTMIRTRLRVSIFCTFVNNRSSSSSANLTPDRGLNYSGLQGGLQLDYKY